MSDQEPEASGQRPVVSDRPRGGADTMSREHPGILALEDAVRRVFRDSFGDELERSAS